MFVIYLYLIYLNYLIYISIFNFRFIFKAISPYPSKKTPLVSLHPRLRRGKNQGFLMISKKTPWFRSFLKPRGVFLLGYGLILI